MAAAPRVARLLVLLVLLCPAAPSWAEIGASVSVQSDARFRAHSLSKGQPVANLAFSYDDVRGFYLGASASAVATEHSGIRFLGSQQNIGFAHRVAPDLTLDIGVDHSNYSEYYSAGHNVAYSELYVGLIGRHLSTHLYYSPDYFDLGFDTIYVELDGVVRPAKNWRLNGHFGVLTRTDGKGDADHDWRIGIATRLDRFDLQLALSGGGPLPQYYNNRRHDRTALTFGITYLF